MCRCRLSRIEFLYKYRSDRVCIVELFKNMNAINGTLSGVRNENINSGIASCIDLFDEPAFNAQILGQIASCKEKEDQDCGKETTEEQHKSILPRIDSRASKSQKEQKKKRALGIYGDLHSGCLLRNGIRHKGCQKEGKKKGPYTGLKKKASNGFEPL